jgi:serine/threonine protein kinase
MARPAEQLTGLKLEGGWVVGELIPRPAGHSGGNFSTSYFVTASDNSKAFLKAMDYQDAFNSVDPAATLNAMTNAYLFERNLLRVCGERRLSKVVRAISDGKVSVSGQPVEYLIFELADCDVRQHLSQSHQFDLAWGLRCLHNIFIGGQQLHGIQVAHQDVKPSNVLTYSGQGQKLADLGRAWHNESKSPFDSLACAGDRRYAPPELLYPHPTPLDNEQRFAADFYLLGSMVLFLFSGMQATAALMSKLAPDHHPKQWRGTYAQVIPYLDHAFAELIRDFKASIANPQLADELADVIEQTCHPDIERRGDRLHRAKIGSRFDLQRLIQRFDRLAKQAELGLSRPR